MPSERSWSAETLATLSMSEIVRLQELLSRELRRRFEKELALGFSDVVGSTDYFERFGDEAGQRLQQRHFDLLGQAVLPAAGRVVDTAGDGAFVVFPSVDLAARAFIALEQAITQENLARSPEQRLSVRIGIHWGRVLTDEQQVTGEAVNLAARVKNGAAPGEIRITKEAFQELSNTLYRLSTRPLGTIELKGITRLVTVFALDWRERDAFPDAVRILETGEEIQLPNQDTIRFGRLKESEGLPANDIVLSLPDETAARKISRWHFELRRHPQSFMLRPVSEQLTEIDGQAIARGAEVPVKPGSIVRVGRVVTLEFVSRSLVNTPGAADATIDNR
ncbi:MAG: adenylate/guanylate cyclase domain-containing protein [Deltaproteobacteria bacterium]